MGKFSRPKHIQSLNTFGILAAFKHRRIQTLTLWITMSMLYHFATTTINHIIDPKPLSHKKSAANNRLHCRTFQLVLSPSVSLESPNRFLIIPIPLFVFFIRFRRRRRSRSRFHSSSSSSSTAAPAASVRRRRGSNPGRFVNDSHTDRHAHFAEGEEKEK